MEPAIFERLERDRANLTQSTAMGVLLLQQEVGLSPETTSELAKKMVERTATLSPSFHEYVNELLGDMVEVFHEQMTTEQAPRTTAAETSPLPLLRPVAAASEPDVLP